MSAPETCTKSALAARRFWPEGWWRWMDIRIGIIPLPVYVLLLALLGVMVWQGWMPGEINIAIAVLAVGGFTCGEIGKRLPYLRHVGAAAILATFLPSYLVYAQWLPPIVVHGVTSFTKSTHFLYLFICMIIVGSILSMDRRVLIQGFLKIFVPLACGSVAAMLVGTLVGSLLGLDVRHTFFYVVIPIMAGGVGEGALPLSYGYAAVLHQAQDEVFAQVLPSVMLGSLTAILLSGLFHFVGRKYPHLSGRGYLYPGEENAVHAYVDRDQEGASVDIAHLAAAGITGISFYVAGLLAFHLFGLPAPISMLFIAVLAKLGMAISPQLQRGASLAYRFFAVAVTYPLLFAIGVSMTPWDKLVSALTLSNALTIASTVATLMITGFYVGRRMGMYPIDTAIVCACHSGQGGTGDVAILSASERMALMPFAQIATRIFGAITVTLVLMVFAYASGF
ncbi:2-hydroxycarboxylate transporter family protein [Dyella choica]|uniref:2-hydroxycarboxylate transporter family protein n=1 Tax=Dyella choica TaxID=1927959 RepID=A0A3S0S1I5_9GAMM|nr:2-hydroxycarboxylate transporter family protein [Dyella choica]RUL77641.1 2-hydroxycarboxylate transporter family protein [Dyella choica]